MNANNWTAKSIKGNRDVVKEQTAKSDLPAHVKAFLTAEVEALPTEVTGAAVTAYAQTHQNPNSPHTMTRVIQVTITGVLI